jgi:Fe2+ transport system protein FeoA
MSDEACAPSISSLVDLQPGDCGVVTDLGLGKTSTRLQSMGICMGRTVELVKKGDPLILKVYGTRIGLSGRLASQIRLQPCERAGRCWERRNGDG